jgi:hypothetical protein
MATSKFSVTQLRKKLEQTKKVVQEEERQKKIQEKKKLDEVRRVESERLKEIKRLESERIELENQFNKKQEYLISLLNGIAKNAIPMALEGIQEIELESDLYEECSVTLEDLGFEFDIQDLETFSLISLSKKIKKLNKQDLDILVEQVQLIMAKFKSIGNKNIFEKVSRIYETQDKKLFCEKSILFFEKIFIDSDDEEYLNSEEYYEDEEDPKPSSNELEKLLSIKKYVKPILKIYLPYSIDHDSFIVKMRWKKRGTIDNNKFWFNSAALKWVSSKNGQDFFNQLLAKIDERIDLLRSNILFKIIHQKSNSIFIFEDGDEIVSPILIENLIPIFEVLGYEIKADYPKNSTLPIKIKLSWGNGEKV